MNTRKRKYDQANGQPGESGSSTRRMSEEKKENSGSIGSRRSPRIKKDTRNEEESSSLSSSTMTTITTAVQETEDDQEERIQLDKKLKAEKERVNDDQEQNENQNEVITEPTNTERSATNDTNLPESTNSTGFIHHDSQPTTQSTVVLLSSSHEIINSLPRTTVTLASSVPYSSSNPDIISSTSTKYHSNFSDSEEDDENKTDANSNLSTNLKGKSNIAILNKTKINTDYIAKILPAHNSQANDPRYDANEINKLRLLSHSYQNFAVKLLTRLFDEEEIIGRNVYGRNYSGDRTVKKQPLDPERIEFIKETVLRLTKTNNPELAWASCVIAMNRKMVDINNKYQKIIGNGGQK